MVRWFLTVLLVSAAARALAAEPDGGTKVELIESEDAVAERATEDELRQLDGRVAELRDRISRTRARLAALQELVTGDDAAAGARTLLRHRNEVGAAFVLEQATWSLDGAPIYTETNASGELERKSELDVFRGRLAPGYHVLAVKLVYRTAGDGGEPQRVRVESSYGFDVQPGKVTSVQSVGHEKKGAGVESRLGVRWKADVEAEKAGAPAGGGSGRR